MKTFVIAALAAMTFTVPAFADEPVWDDAHIKEMLETMRDHAPATARQVSHPCLPNGPCFTVEAYLNSNGDGGGQIYTIPDNGQHLRWCTWNGGPHLGRLCHGDKVNEDHFYPNGSWFEIPVPALGRWMAVIKVDDEACNHGREWPQPGSVNAQPFLDCLANSIVARSPQLVADKKAQDAADAKAADDARAAAVAAKEQQTRAMLQSLADQAARDRARHAEDCKEAKERTLRTSGLVQTVDCPQNEKDAADAEVASAEREAARRAAHLNEAPRLKAIADRYFTSAAACISANPACNVRNVTGVELNNSGCSLKFQAWDCGDGMVFTPGADVAAVRCATALRQYNGSISLARQTTGLNCKD